MFISMGGFAKDAVDALIAGKSLNLVLFNGDDMRKLVRLDSIAIEAAIDFKLRAAAEEGTPFLPLPDPHAYLTPGQTDPVVVVEGSYDALLLETLIKAHDSQLRPVFTSASGRLNLPLVALAQASLLPGVKRLIVVADGEGRPEEVKRDIELALSESAGPPDVQFMVVVIDPDLETALALVAPIVRRRPSIKVLAVALQRVDLRRLAAANREVADLLRLLGLLGGEDDRHS